MRVTDFFRAAFVAFLLSFALPAQVHSQAAVCAEVKIEIPQQLSMERQAFVARLGINNEVDLPISNFGVLLQFKDDQGNIVLASSDPQNTSAKFFFRLDETSNLSGGVSGAGTVAANTSAFVTWLIVPASGTGGTTPLGKAYLVGATISYSQGGANRTVNVVPDGIVVEPQPKLKLDYFLPDDVYGDDPFTPAPEAPVPFTLGMRIKNIGGGASRQTRVESAQPRIVQNIQGLLINFQILSSFIQNEATEPSLLLNFGEILPGRSKVGRWQMTTSLTGRFTEFVTSFTHDPSSGGALTSLIESVSPHTLVKDVLVNLPGRDGVRDFLARDIDTYRSYESDGVDTEVINRSTEAQIAPLADGKYRITLPNSILPSFARVLDPTNGSFVIETAARVGGANLPVENAWTSKTRLGSATTFTHYLNVYDPSGSGSYILTPRLLNQAKISGDVYRDRNANGVRDPNENGILNATVSLTGTTESGTAVSLNQQTNPDGGYIFSELSQGNYAVRVQALLALTDGVAIVGSAGGVANPGAITEITLDQNEVATGYRFAKLSTSVSPLADLAPEFEAINPSIATGATLDVTLRLRNYGPDDATGSTQITMPTGMVLVSANTTSGTFSAASGLWRTPACWQAATSRCNWSCGRTMRVHARCAPLFLVAWLIPT